MDEMDLTDIHTVFHLPAADYTLFSAAHGTFFKIDHSHKPHESLFLLT
jgi:hypothetical protein